jgi:hypothetical protein
VNRKLTKSSSSPLCLIYFFLLKILEYFSIFDCLQTSIQSCSTETHIDMKTGFHEYRLAMVAIAMIEFFLPFKFLEGKKHTHILLGADAESESLRLSYWCPGLRVKCAMAAATASIGCQGRGVRRALPTFRRAASSRLTTPPGVPALAGCAIGVITPRTDHYTTSNCLIILNT